MAFDGGRWSGNAYIRGETYEVNVNFDIDAISTLTFCQLVRDLGYPPNTPLWYLHPVKGFMILTS
jgi:hypothetical protein